MYPYSPRATWASFWHQYEPWFPGTRILFLPFPNLSFFYLSLRTISTQCSGFHVSPLPAGSRWNCLLLVTGISPPFHNAHNQILPPGTFRFSLHYTASVKLLPLHILTPLSSFFRPSFPLLDLQLKAPIRTHPDAARATAVYDALPLENFSSAHPPFPSYPYLSQ